MKKLIFIYIILLGVKLTFAQDTTKLKGFREIILPEYSNNFKQANLTENGRLILSATDKYILLSASDKKATISPLINAWQDSLILVSYGSKRELWGWDTVKGNVKQYDYWDLSSHPLDLKPAAIISERSHPWFIYIGGQLGGDNQKNINMAFNARFGFFLLLNRWDLATSLSAGLSENTASAASGYNSTSTWSSLGLMTRVHFPIRKIGLSPNIGLELSKSVSGDISSDALAHVVLGFRWFVGFGSIDIGIKLGEESSGMGGVTLVPGSKK
jgi:hypothetical protein